MVLTYILTIFLRHGDMYARMLAHSSCAALDGMEEEKEVIAERNVQLQHRKSIALLGA